MEIMLMLFIFVFLQYLPKINQSPQRYEICNFCKNSIFFIAMQVWQSSI